MNSNKRLQHNPQPQAEWVLMKSGACANRPVPWTIEPVLTRRKARNSRTWVAFVLAAFAVSFNSRATPAQTQVDDPPTESASATEATEQPADNRTARQLVREGNQKLQSGEPETAIDLYDRARRIKPEAAEIAFDQGLAHFRRGDYEKAREAFNEAVHAENAQLADDALYGMAASEHAAALQVPQPDQAIPMLEDAMMKYQDVLSHQPGYDAVRDAHFKAVEKWRQLKQLQEQQQQQQQQQQEQDEQDQEDQEEQQDQQPQQQEADQQQESEQQDQQEAQQQNQQQEQQQPDEQQQQQSAEEQQQEQSQEQPADADPAPDENKEQARRELRRLMDHMRQRKQNRQEPPAPVQPSRPDKEW